ncbi:hypothetical protein A3B51_03135 [Candidatus Curtissbacteria bacterium RIFCSPLOWO2_01_FULL_41_18]|uniref:Uncharacterized protein n=2 Tax=Candidatus Curtissiibacteriota TaxID=1752717 RepID=A0A1F5G2P6_9BACT|nr:MAG: hypothetical protein A2696_02330 [Candidatus Curtissbacteria bacterium RIFCSPHIGHO2_01_FULL_41_13]OGE04008.1 MAG: hypothetical protein A3B51_03135 [Candidatus Curtissbacteria bacterium RIFCSPLOWO2_01_FULL_41_18]
MNKDLESTQEKVVEKYYIEVGQSTGKNFLRGLVGGLGWGIGITLGTTVIIALFGFIVSKIDLIPLIGHFTAEVIKAAQQNLKGK